MSLALIDGMLFTFYRLEIFVNNISSIGARDMKTPPFDAYRHGDSNELLFILIPPIGSEPSRHFDTLKLQKTVIQQKICPNLFAIQ